MAQLLPEFKRPPVTEVAISVQFAPLAYWQGVHAGLYWSRIQEDYPETQLKAPLPPIEENYETTPFLFSGEKIHIAPFDHNQQRSWFLNQRGDRLLQLQKNRFVFNWRKVSPEDIYPRFEYDLRPTFVEEWKKYRRFIAEKKLGDIKKILVEVVYVNDFIEGNEWHSFDEAMALFSHWKGVGSTKFLPNIEAMQMRGAFKIPQIPGRLYFDTNYVIRQMDSKKAVQLNISCRIAPIDESDKGVMDAIDEARSWVVNGFTDLTSSKAHEIWGKK